MHHRFVLERHVDVSGVSGIGDVAEGTQFSDGAVALRWPTKAPCTIAFDNIEDALAVHGHGGKTVVRWIDPAGQEPLTTTHNGGTQWDTARPPTPDPAGRAPI